MRVLAALWSVLLCLSLTLLSQTANRTPVINQPLSPASTAPGGGGFMLTVNGTGFVAGSVVNWNSSPRPTTVVSSSQLTATIGASDIAASATAAVTVSNPAPGGGISNVVFLPITSPTTSVSLARSDLATSSAPFSIAVGDFTGTGNLSLATANYGANTVSVLLGKGDGTFAGAVDYPSGNFPTGIIAADFNNDGILDLAVANSLDDTVSVLLGTGNGTFNPKTDYVVGSAPLALRAADLNGDGNLDLVVANSGSATVSVLLGNGDGTFATAVSYPTGNNPQSLVIGDFNGDGKLDVAVADNADNLVSVLLGNGDGSLQPKVDYPAQTPSSLAVADLNGDGFLDLAASSGSNEVSVLLGNRDGTFLPAVTYPTPGSADSVVVGDLNGDGKLDLAVADFDTSQISILLGNGDGTFQSSFDYSTPASAETVAVGDFNGDGRLDVVAAIYKGSSVSVFLQSPAVSLSATSLTFANQNVGTTSTPQSTTLANTGSATLSISGISITGQNSGDFAQTNTCIPNGNTTATLAAGANCSITVTFTPSATGTRTAQVTLADNAGDSPQIVTLTGTGEEPIASVSPPSLTFSSQLVGTTSPPQPVTLNNTGNGLLTVAAVSATAGFTTTTNCVGASPLQPGASCSESVTFTPPSAGTASGTLSFTDNSGSVPGSTQSVSLSGTGIKGNTTTTIRSVTPSPSVAGQAVTVAFSVTPAPGDPLAPTGSVAVTASIGESCSGVAPSGSCSLIFNTAGSRTLTATYSGDNNFNGSSSPAVTQSVSKATTSTVLASSADPSVAGNSVTFTATVSSNFGPPPNGETVSFKQGTTVLGNGKLSGGLSTYSTSSLKIGMPTITAVYAGDVGFSNSSGTLTQNVITASAAAGYFNATPLTDMTSNQLYLGVFKGMLFDDPPFSGTPTNTPPSGYDGDARALATQILNNPLDAHGNPSPSGKIVMISIGMSISRREFCAGLASNTGQQCVEESFECQSQGANALGYTQCANPTTSHWHASVNTNNLVLVNCSQESQILKAWASGTTAGDWYRCGQSANMPRGANPGFLGAAGVTPAQVQAIFFKDVNSGQESSYSLPASCCDMAHLVSQNFSCDVRDLPGSNQVAYPANTQAVPSGFPDTCLGMLYMGQILRLAKQYYPNVKLVFVESRSYAGYSTLTIDPEPFAYENGFMWKWIIGAQQKQTLAQYGGSLSTVTGYSGNGTTATYKASNNFSAGQQVAVYSLTGAGSVNFNVIGTISSATATQFQMGNTHVQSSVVGQSGHACVLSACPFNQMTLDISYGGTACAGGPCSPMVVWGPYLWAPPCVDGTRADGVCWNITDFTAQDYVHTKSLGPSYPYQGIMKSTSVTVPSMLSSPYSSPWFGAH